MTTKQELAKKINNVGDGKHYWEGGFGDPEWKSPLDDDFDRMKILSFVKAKEDIQGLRIKTGNRIVASFRQQLGQDPGKKLEEMDEEGKKLMSVLMQEFNRVADGMATFNETIKKTIARFEASDDKKVKLSFIRSETDFLLLKQYNMLLDLERVNTDTMCKLVKEYPLWDEFFDEIRGVGPELAAVCIALFDPYKARHCSNFWAYAGLNPVTVEDKEGNTFHQANSKKYTVEKEYTDKDGQRKTKKSITYQPFLKTYLLGVGATNMIKTNIRTEKDENKKPTGRKFALNKYATQYMHYKNRKQLMCPDLNGKHIDLIAKRWMMRNFVRDLWVAWRSMLGLPVSLPYEIEYLGRTPHAWPNETTWYMGDDGKEIAGRDYDQWPDIKCNADIMRDYINYL